MTTLSIIIPVFNEERTVKELLSRVWDVSLEGIRKEILIVESNSRDDSRLLVRRFAESRPKGSTDQCVLILEDSPKGKGHAVRRGLKAATGDIILIQDADLEYEVEDYSKLLAPILSKQTSFVLGSRHLDTGWKIRAFDKHPWKASLMNFGGIFFHGFFNLVYSQKLTDPTTMYKVFRRECIQGLKFTANRFDFDYELLGKLIRAGHHPMEVSIRYSSRGFEEGKKISILRDPWTWVAAILKYRFSPLEEF